jgi:hypothetical protein
MLLLKGISWFGFSPVQAWLRLVSVLFIVFDPYSRRQHTIGFEILFEFFEDCGYIADHLEAKRMVEAPR